MQPEAGAKRRYLRVPAQFEVCAGAEAACAAIGRALPVLADGQPRVSILSGEGPTAPIAASIRTGIADAAGMVQHYRLGGCMREDVQQCARALLGTLDVLVAVGGGSVIDPAKLIAEELDVPLVVVPTALSSDCIGSPVAVLMDAAGKKHSLPAAIPNFVVVDTAVTTAAPASLALAGLCDVLSNASAVLDAAAARDDIGYNPDNFALALAEGAYRLLVPVDWSLFNAHAGHEKLVKALVLSGLAMGFSGDSVPCSGAEHAISHAIDYLFPGSTAHGLQVGVTTIYCHYLRQRLSKPALPKTVLAALREIRPALTPAAIGLTKVQFLAAATMGQQIRPGRYTVLNQRPDQASLHAAYDAAFS